MTATEATRHAAADVRPLAEAMLERLRPHAERAEIAGSLRRQKADVKDIEIVLLNPLPTLYDYTERLVESGHAERAIYTDGKPRWGRKYRGLLIRGVKVELFCADSDNWGYQWWLRTGPGDANKVMVTALKHRCTSFRVADGYLWATYSSLELPPEQLSVPSEADLFQLFGIPFIEPVGRTVKAYNEALALKTHRWGNPAPFIKDAAAQAGLQATAAAETTEDFERQARWEAEAAYAATLGTKSLMQLADEAEANRMPFVARCYRDKARESGEL